MDLSFHIARPLELLGSASSSSKPSSSAMASSIEKYQNEVAARLKGTSEVDKVIEKEVRLTTYSK